MDESALEFLMGESVLVQFVAAHDPAAVLRELVQNEYDARGRTLEVTFGKDSLRVRGSGRRIDAAGWKRLSLMLGTGLVHGTGERVEQKANSIGSKNFGLRSLFLFGDRIFVRSGGRQRFLDRLGGTSPLLKEPSSKSRPGVQIDVPYRAGRDGLLQPFDARHGEDAVDSLARELGSTLVKLAEPGQRRSLEEVVVRAEGSGRRLAWKQSVERVRTSAPGIRVLRRVVRQSDSTQRRPQWLEELEFQTELALPKQFRDEPIPGYFAVPEERIRLGVSVRVRKDGIDLDHCGTFYYPLGVPQGYTGTAVSVNAPFAMDGDRSQLLVNPWNMWLLASAADLTLRVAKEDWLERFGAAAFLALRETAPAATPAYAATIRERLAKEPCWPSRERSGEVPVFVAASFLVVAEAPELDGFITSPKRHLDDRLSAEPTIRDMVLKLGAASFTLNSLVRLRCAGEKTPGLATRVDKQANFYYDSFPSAIAQTELQAKFARALDAHARHLSPDNWRDLKTSLTTLTGAQKLERADALWVVPPEFVEVCRIPESRRLHPVLVGSRVLSGIGKRFNPNNWAREVAENAREGRASQEEREALYKHIVVSGASLPLKLRAFLRNSPVLRDHEGAWVAPAEITLRGVSGADALASVLHFPHPDFTHDRELAQALRFRVRIDGGDIVAFARLVEDDPDLAPQLEDILRGWHRLLTPPLARAMAEIKWCRAPDGVASPEELYLDTPENRMCLGPDGAFATARLNPRLLERLGCRPTAEWQDIAAYLEGMAPVGTPLEGADRVYPALVDAMRAKRVDPSRMSEQRILWTGQEWSRPFDALVGSSTRIPARAVPQVARPTPALAQALSALGVSRMPQARHWRRVLSWVAERYRARGLVVSEADRVALRTAYAHLSGPLDEIADDARVFLDRTGRVHSLRNVKTNRFLIDDDPALAAAVEAADVPVVFADAATETLPFLHDQGVSTLRRVRSEPTYRAGAAQTAPAWLDLEDTLARLHDPMFAAAVGAVVAHAARRAGRRGEDSTRTLARRLRTIREIHTHSTLRAEYRIAGRAVSVSRALGVETGRFILAGVRSRRDFMDLLSRAVAEVAGKDTHERAELADPLYRLLTCVDAEEMEQYLANRGIPWSARCTRREPDDDAEETNADAPVQQVLGDILTHTLGSVEREMREAPAVQEQDVQQAPPLALEPRPLPPMGEVEPEVVVTTGSWHPSSRRARSGRPHGRGWNPPGSQDEERNRALGRRGEEIVAGLERARVREAGMDEALVIHVSAQDAGADHDILSVDPDGERRWVEVKATTGRDGRFQWSRSEFELALRKRSRYVLYRVYEAASTRPTVKVFEDPIGMLLVAGMGLDIASLHAEVEPLRRSGVP